MTVHDVRDMGQQDDQPKDTPNVVYAVVNKSKKKRRLRVVLVLPLHRTFAQSSTMK